MHQLEVHHVGLEVRYCIREFGKGGLEGVEREGIMALDASLGGFAKGGSGRGTEGCRGTRSRGGARSPRTVMAFAGRHGALCEGIEETKLEQKNKSRLWL